MPQYLRYGLFLVVFCFLFIPAAGCASSATPADVVTTLYPVQWMTNQALGVDCSGTGGLNDGLTDGLTLSGNASTSDPKLAQVLAGYNDSNIDGCRVNTVYRGAFRFDIPAGVTITRAILKFRTTRFYYLTIDPFATYSKSGPYSCVSSLQVGDADWTTGSYDPSTSLIPSVSYYPLPSGDLTGRHDDLSNPSGVSVMGVDDMHAGFGTPSGAYFAVNATGQVNEWAGEDPGQNHGFILVSRNEDLGTGINEACASLFDGISLEIHSPGLFPVDSPAPATSTTTKPTPVLTESP